MPSACGRPAPGGVASVQPEDAASTEGSSGQSALHELVDRQTPRRQLITGYTFEIFFMKTAELKCQNLIVKKVCQVEHFKTFRKAIGPELGL